MEHKLIIESLYDGIATCKCGAWHYYYTGETTVGEINIAWLKHMGQFVGKEIEGIGKEEIIRIR